MIDAAALEAWNRRIASARPRLLGSFHSWVEALARFRPVGAQDMEALFQLTLGTEYAYADPPSLIGLLLQRDALAPFASLLQAVAARDSRCASVLLGAYPRLALDLGVAGSDILSIATAAALPAARAHEALAFCLAAREAAASRFFLGQFAIVGRLSPAALPGILRLVSERVGKMEDRAIWEWLSRGTDLMTSGRVDEGVKLLLLESGAGRRLMGLKQAVLEEFKSTLTIYAASLAGRDLNLAPLGVSMFGLDHPYTDGANLFLPPEIHFFKDEEMNRKAYSTMAALMAGGLRLGSWGLDFAQLGFRDELMERYGSALPKIMDNLRRQYAGLVESIHERADGEIEAVFSKRKRIVLLRTGYEKLFFSLPAPLLARELFGLLENYRIASRLGSLYPGFRKDYALLNAYRFQVARAEAQEESPEHALFMRFLDSFIHLSLCGRHQGRTLDGRLGAFVEDARAALNALHRPSAAVEDTAQAMFRVYNLLSERFRLGVICQRLDLGPIFAPFRVPGFWPEIVASVSPGLMKLEAEREYIPIDAEEPQLYDFSSARTRGKEALDLAKALAEGRTRAFRYREWDHLRGSYLADRCTLFESVLPSAQSDYYQGAMRRYALVFKQTRKRFLAMKPEEVELSRGWYDGNEINVSDMVDFCQSLERGESPDEKIYYQKILNRRDLAVAVLLDSSNSTSAEIGGARIIDMERDSLAILASALDAIDDSFALFSFSSAGPNKVYFSVIKDFVEAWGPAAQGRMASLEPYESNRDGCAIRHAAARLSRRPEKTKLLIILSDGIPADIDYGTQTGMRAAAYAIEDTRMAVLEAREQGISPFCINIDSQAKDYISRLYGAYHYVILNDVARLPERLSSLYLRITV